MDGFPMFPLEIVRLILVEAVKVRGIKRAARLRYVSRSWDHEVTEAILESGILDNLTSPEKSFFWPKLLTYKVMRKAMPFTRELRIIRRVAEHILSFHGQEESEETLTQFVFEICSLTPNCNAQMRDGRLWLEKSEDDEVESESEIINENDEDFLESLLAVAAATNDMVLVTRVLPVVRGRPHLIYQQGSIRRSPIFGHPVDVAGFKGHTEAMRALLEALEKPSDLGFARLDALEAAGEGNHLEIIELCLESAYSSHSPTLTSVLEVTTNIHIFDRVLPLCKDHLKPPYKLKQNERMEELLPGFLFQRFFKAVERGDLAMIRHLVQLGVTPRDYAGAADDQYGYCTLISHAAAGGHIDVVIYLLENGLTPGSRSLEAASKHGNAKCVKLLLEHGATDSFGPGSALLEAVNRENELVLQLLLESGIMKDVELRRRALEITNQNGLVSIATMIEDSTSSSQLVSSKPV